MNSFPEKISAAILDRSCLLLVLSAPHSNSQPEFQKITVRPVSLKGEECYQASFQTAKQEMHKNFSPAETLELVREQFGSKFKDCNAFTAEADYRARLKKSGTVRLKTSAPTRTAVETEHNRAKQYLIPEGTVCPFLVEIGVMTVDGKVRKSKYHKFRQINRFLELINDIISDLPTEKVLNIVDFGCGKSYLTFALHHLLTEIHSREVTLIGLDYNESVIQTCSNIANKLDCQGLSFSVGNIADFQPTEHVNLAVSLHACDTATDDAISQAIGWQSEVILAVPCCQHELFKKIRLESLQPLEQHGILKERFAALATDALRAQVLELCGYKTQVVEFIDLEHTPKNILIRAVRRDATEMGNRDLLEAYRNYKQSLGLGRLYLEEALLEDFPDLFGDLN